jgi:CBS domain-containing protein
MHTTAADLLKGACIDFLRRFPPFDGLETEALDFIAEHLDLAFYPAGEALLTPDMGRPEHLFILQRGRVQAHQGGAASVTEYTTLPLGMGDFFPVGALSASRPTVNHYIALEDTFAYRLPAARFHELLQRSTGFHLHCTRYIADLLNQARQQLQNITSQRASEHHSMATPLSKLITRAPASVSVQATVREALEAMASHGTGCMAIVNDEEQPVGVLTHRDVVSRIVLSGFDLTRPVVDIMTPAPYVLPTSALAYDAVLEMATHSVHHLLIVDAQGRLKGIVSERDLFSLQRLGLRQIRASIEGAQDLEALRQASHETHQLAINLLNQGVGAERLTHFISSLNDALTRRIIALALDDHDLRGLRYAWLAFGSEGRNEQTLATDQDNGLIFVCHDPATREALRQRWLGFANTVNTSLAACGFPLCKGNIMARNPELCLTLNEWQHRFAAWIDEPNPEALLNATIFFDFRVISGDKQLEERLRQSLNRMVQSTPNFLRMMAANALQVSPPVGRFRDFILNDDGALDLKVFGSRLFVDAARIYALRTGLSASNTVQRLRQAGARIGIQPDELAALIDGFHFIQSLRLRLHTQEFDAAATGGAQTENPDRLGDNLIRPQELNELDRRILKEALRQTRKLQTRLRFDYQL